MNKIKIPWDSQINCKDRVMFFCLGLIVFCFCSYNFVENVYQVNDFVGYIKLASYLPFLLIGFLFITIIFDWNNKYVKYILCGLLGAFITLVVLRQEAQIGLILFISSLASVIIYKMLENVFITITTFFFLGLCCLPIIFKMCRLFSDNMKIIIYFTVTLYILFFRFVGLKLNKWVLNHFAKTLEHEYYNVKHFKNLLSLIYTTIFVGLNLGVYAYGLEDVWFNLINNAFLTGITIIQLDWKNIFIFTNRSE